MRALPATLDGHHSYAGGLLEHTVGVATLCRETAQLHQRLRADLLLAAALVHDVGRTRRARPRAGLPPDRRGTPARPRASRAAPDRGARADARPGVRAELLHAVACHHDVARGAHRRGGGAVPREPARRGRRDEARPAIDRSPARARREPLVGLRRLRRGLGGAAPVPSRGRGVSQAAGLVFVGASSLAIVRPDVADRGAARAGARSPARRRLRALVRSIARSRSGRWGSSGRSRATGAVVPLAYGLARGERPSALQGAGVALAVVGVIAASLEPPPDGEGDAGSARASASPLARARVRLRARRPEPRAPRAARCGRRCRCASPACR